MVRILLPKALPSHVDYLCVLVGCDVVTLYTSIPYDLGSEALSYWITKKRNLIPERFTKAFILEVGSFVLSNNDFQFDIYMFVQLVGPAMGLKFAPPYTSLSVGYLEETILFLRLLLLHFTLTEYKLIEEIFKCFRMMVLFHGQKMLILMYLESFSMNDILH